MNIHKPSLFVGAAVVAACFVAVSAVQATATTAQHAMLRIAGIPAPEQIVRITGADLPFTVPAGRTLVVLAAGAIASNAIGSPENWQGSILVDGQRVLSIALWDNTGVYGGNVLEFGPGIVVKGGSVLSAQSVGYPATLTLFGYVAP